jgi:hypothetical protein
MLEQTSVPGTDDWWLTQLAIQYGADLPRLYRLQSYSDGTNALPDEIDAGMREAYLRFIHLSRLNMAELIVSARVSRMKILGFRTAAAGDVTGDAAAWATWKRSAMKVGSRDMFRDAGVFGSSYLTTTGPSTPSADAQPYLIPSNGMTTATRQYTTQPWLSEAAIQVGYDDANQADLITLFRAGYMRIAYKPSRVPSVPTNGTPWLPGRGWAWATDPIPLGYTDQVPVFKLNGPDGKGMFEKHIDSLDRISNTIRDRLTITAMQAFKQRALKGDLPDEYPDGDLRAGQKVDYNGIFAAGPAALWKLPTGIDIWESTVTDITPILGATKDDTKNLAAVSSTPMYILSPDAANGSAEGASLARETLVFSVEEWIDHAEMPLALSLAASFQAQGDTARAVVGDIEAIWAPADRSSIVERASAAAQAKLGGLPQSFIDEKIFQLTPFEIEQAKQDRADEAFLAVPAPGAAA